MRWRGVSVENFPRLPVVFSHWVPQESPAGFGDLGLEAANDRASRAVLGAVTVNQAGAGAVAIILPILLWSPLGRQRTRDLLLLIAVFG